MHERSLNEAERILATHKDVVVPVKEIWLEVSRQGQLQRFEVLPLVDFSALLEGDERFEFFPAGDELGDDYVEATDEDDIDYATDMERLGFYSEDRVRLRNIEVTEDLAEGFAEEHEEPDEEREQAPRLGPSSPPRTNRPISSTPAKKSPHRRMKPEQTNVKKRKATVANGQKRKGKSK